MYTGVPGFPVSVDSGAANPVAAPVWASGGDSLATPKSSTLIVPSRAIMTLAGFKSRWTTPLAWAAASADAS